MSDYADLSHLEDHIAEVIPLARGRLREVDPDAIDLTKTRSAPPTSTPLQEIPPHLLHVDGLVGHITRWITKTALYPQPLLALGAALAVVGTAAGRKYAGPTKSGTHLYVLALAVTGAGKNHPAKLAKRLMRASKMDELVGPSQFMSEPAVWQTLAKRAQLLCFMDELGSYLGRINSKQASGHEKGISGALRTFWGASFETQHPPAWAQSSSRDPLQPIHSPSLSIYGMSVHEEFYAALQSNDIANGFLNRFLILSTHLKPEEVEPELSDDDVPEALINWLQMIAAPVSAPRGYGRSSSDDGWKAEVRVDWDCAEARLIYREFRKAIEASGDDAKLLSRVPEMAVRLATIRAIGRTKIGDPRINVADIQWATELAMWSGQRMVADTAAYMTESEYQGRAKEVLRYIRDAGRITHTELSRKVKHKFEARVLRAILEGLQDADHIEVVRERAEGAKKPTDFIIYRGG